MNDVQERQGAFLAQFADEPGDEKCGVAFAAMLRAHADRADLNRSIEPHALASHGGERAVDPNANILAKLMRAWAKRAGIRLLGETQHLRDVAWTEHDGRRALWGRRRLSRLRSSG